MRVSIFSTILLLLASSSRADSDADKVEEDDPYLYNEVDFADFVETEPHFIMFFAPWCGHCKSLKPTWQELSDFYNDQESDIITIAKVDCTTDTKLCSEHGVTGYPTLKLFQPGEEALRYQGARNLESLKKFISDTLKLDDGETDGEKPSVQVEEGLYELTADTFDDHIATGAHFVKFFAPWCGHCKRMEPAWKELAAKMKDSAAVKIGRVDCTQNQQVCGSKGVRGYPTLIFFKDGQEVEKYQGGRQLDEFLSYVGKMTGEKKQATTEEEEKEVVKEKPDEPEIVDGLYELKVDNYEPLTAGCDFFIKFFAPWCGHCKRMEPAWKELAKLYEEDDKVRIGRVDCTKQNSLCQSNGVRGYPTLKYFRNGKEMTGSPAGRDIESLKSFVETMSAKQVEVEEEKVEEQVQEQQKEPEEEEEKGGAVELTDDNFPDTIESGGIVFVKFYAPWCGHCKRLAPAWDELAAQDFSELSHSVVIAKVDCTKYNPTCSANEVKGYPTLKLFVNGEMKQKYQGARTLEALTNFVLEKGVDAEEEKDQQQMKDEL